MVKLVSMTERTRSGDKEDPPLAFPTAKRLVPLARSLEDRHQNFPLYQYALNEYAQTALAGTSNDSGRRARIEESADNAIDPCDSYQQDYRPTSPQLTTNPTTESVLSSNYSHFESQPDAIPTFIAYEEYYGDAYTGQPIKYLYPLGYQSMRPRKCPWKLSIVVTVLFSWLSVFIVGHCSDQYEYEQNQQENNEHAANMAAEYDDDTMLAEALKIESRWCGSTPLYLMGAACMLITGLSSAYCCVIGYIQIRDIAVANARSQPPGITSDATAYPARPCKSDYYVRIDEADQHSDVATSTANSNIHVASLYRQLHPGSYRRTIYQADGTPQFWGAHIHHPTQAAAALTNR
jgi:hypothetical protein